MDETKIYDKTDKVVDKNIENYPTIKIVKAHGFLAVNAQAYTLKKSKDGFNYLAELPIINHDPEFVGTICYLFDELTPQEQEKYECHVDSIIVKDTSIKCYDRPQSWSKSKKRCKRRK